jgi:phosphonoacetate hydrolase
VNNVSIITGVYPKLHGITSNYYLDTETGEEMFMESSDFLSHPTVLERARDLGMSTALLTSKKKLLHLLNTGADYSLAAEDPDQDMVKKLGPPSDIYSPGINLWLFKALSLILQERDPDVAYCSTTDGMMHRHSPQAEESRKHVQGLDRILGRILDDNPDREVYLTADHGMSAKSLGIDIEKALALHGIRARAIPIIKDRYIVHHQNLGGAAYVYLSDSNQIDEAIDTLRGQTGIEEVYGRAETAERFGLMKTRIGDIFVLADEDTVFGEFETMQVPVAVRSHGSRYESGVPILTYGGKRGLITPSA